MIKVYPEKLGQSFDLLIIEDDEDDYFLVSEYIEELFESAKIQWAPTAEAAQRELKRNQHDLCFLDVNLSGANGVELLDYAQQVGFQGPIVMLTGMSDQHTDALAAAKGAVDYIVKDEMNRGQIARCIRYALSRKEAYEERLRRTRLESESNAKTRFLANLSHELRSPLSAILGFSELLLDSDLASQPRESVSIIHRNGLHLLSLLDDVMDIAKIESGRMEIECTEINFEKFLRTVQKSLAISAQKKGLYLRFHCKEVLPSRIYSDLTRLRQILINVINNAIKYTSTGGIDVTVSFEDYPDRQMLRFAVADTGAGIEKENLADIFRPFSQLDDAKVYREGAGLGLAICQQLARGMGGDISCESEVGVGSTFTFGVQIGVPERSKMLIFDLDAVDLYNATPSSTGLSGEDASLLAGRYVLIADDLPDVRQFMRRFILQLGAKPLLAKNGLEAIEISRAHEQIVAAFIDLQMPVMNGFKAAESIRAARPDLALYALTASADANVHELAIKAGFDEAFAKPISFNALSKILLAAVKKAIKNRRDGTSQLRTQSSDEQIAATSEQSDTQRDLLRVLIVDDDSDLGAIMGRLTTMIGHKGTVVSSVKEALLALQHASYDLILLDKNLGADDAMDIPRFLKEKALTVPVYIVSGEAANDEMLAHPSVKGSLLKPLNRETLIHTFNKISPLRS